MSALGSIAARIEIFMRDIRFKKSWTLDPGFWTDDL